MKLSEIVSLTPVLEADEASETGKGPVELSDILKDHDAKYAKRFVAALWGKPRLSYHGKQFFGAGDNDLYGMIDSAVKAYIDDGFEVDISIAVEDPKDLGMDELNYKATLDDQQEVYLGYDPKSDQLFVGIDAWLREEDFNDAWDREFENETGEEYDEENEVHAAMFHSAWENYKDMGFFGVLFEMKFDGSSFDIEPVLEAEGGFYKGIYRDARFKQLGLFDLRLD